MADMANCADRRRPRPLMTRRSLLSGGAAMGLGALLASCSYDSRHTDGASAAVGNASQGATDSFPVTIEHVYGSTTVSSEPLRVAAVSSTNDDVVIALGVIPVGVPEAPLDVDGLRACPWTTSALEALGAGWDSQLAPAQYSQTNGINIEAISELEPDLILGVSSSVTQEEYTALSAIAPTIAYPAGGAKAADWQATTTIIGQALGRSAAAEELVATTIREVTASNVAYPHLKGSTFVAGTLTAGLQNGTLYTAADPRPQFLTLLGMKMAAAAAKAGADSTTSPTVSVPAQDCAAMSCDLLWVEAEDAQAVEAVKADAVLQTIPAVANDSALFVTDAVTVASLQTPSPLSLLWAVEHHVPQIAAAIESATAATATATASTGATASTTAGPTATPPASP